MPSVKRKETMEYLALVAEIIAAAGVIISVIYLALQVNDSNIEMRAQTHYNALTLAQRPLEMLVERPELGELVTKAQTASGELTAAERERLTYHYFLLFNAWEYTYLLSRTASISPDFVQAHEGYMKLELKRSPMALQMWREFETGFSNKFQTYIGKILNASKASE
jgi:hypothetical protein